jgi:hypothetical protein
MKAVRGKREIGMWLAGFRICPRPGPATIVGTLVLLIPEPPMSLLSASPRARRPPRAALPSKRLLRHVAGVVAGLSGLLATAAQGADLPGAVLASDDFRHGTGAWRIEQQSPQTRIQTADGELDLLAPAGLTLRYREAFAGDYEIQLTATPLTASFPGLPDRLSDLNLFWNATTAEGGDPGARQADGALGAYDALHLYYLGFGANGNRSTRLRRYDGTAARPLVAGYAEPSLATADDRLGAPPAFARLKDGQAVRLRIQSRASPDHTAELRVFADDQLVFAWTDPAPYRHGWLALRTTASHLRIKDFRVLRL